MPKGALDGTGDSGFRKRVIDLIKEFFGKESVNYMQVKGNKAIFPNEVTRLLEFVRHASQWVKENILDSISHLGNMY